MSSAMPALPASPKSGKPKGAGAGISKVQAYFSALTKLSFPPLINRAAGRGRNNQLLAGGRKSYKLEQTKFGPRCQATRAIA